MSFIIKSSEVIDWDDGFYVRVHGVFDDGTKGNYYVQSRTQIDCFKFNAKVFLTSFFAKYCARKVIGLEYTVGSELSPTVMCSKKIIASYGETK